MYTVHPSQAIEERTPEITLHSSYSFFLTTIYLVAVDIISCYLILPAVPSFDLSYKGDRVKVKAGRRSPLGRDLIQCILIFVYVGPMPVPVAVPVAMWSC